MRVYLSLISWVKFSSFGGWGWRCILPVWSIYSNVRYGG